jgi:hypothetical protein
MGKYSDIVKSKSADAPHGGQLELNSSFRGGQGNEPESQKSAKVENNKTISQQNSKTGNVEQRSSAKKPRHEQVLLESNKSGKRQSMKTSNTENQKTREEELVNLSIKVPRRLRQKWVAESRLRGTTLTAIISDYLKTELGE